MKKDKLQLPRGHCIAVCTKREFEAVLAVINNGAQAYRGVIPRDCWHEPYMSAHELAAEIHAGVQFLGYHTDAGLTGVMGMQAVEDVTLIRHAYVSGAFQRMGMGSALLQNILDLSDRPCLVGTWAAAHWATAFYRRHGFEQVDNVAGTALLRRYWRIRQRQIDTSVVLRRN